MRYKTLRPVALRFLRLLADFAQSDLQRTPARKIERFRRGLVRITDYFIGVGDLTDLTHITWRNTSEPMFLFQQKIAAVLEKVVAGEASILIEGNFSMGLHLYEEGNAYFIEPAGKKTDGTLMYSVLRVIETAGPGKVLHCSLPDCRRYFVKMAGQQYCSKRHQMRAYMRTRREVQRQRDRQVKMKGGRGAGSTTTRKG